MGQETVSAQRPVQLTKQLVKLAGPMVLSNLAYTLLGAVDTFFMGRVSTLALGAVGIASMAFLAPSLILRGTIGGAMPFAARRYGAKDYNGAGQALQHFLLLAVLLIPLTLVLPLAFDLYFGLTQPDPKITELAQEYIRVRLWEIPFSLLSGAMFSFMMGIGNSRTPMVMSWTAVIVNIAANYVLVFGKLGFPALGLVGAAWGTVFAVAIQTGLYALITWRRYAAQYNLRSWSFPSWSQLVAMIKVGFPIGLADSIEVSAFSTFLALISRLGPIELAASQIANQISALAFMPGFALGSATGSLVGRYLGAGHPETSQAVGYRGAMLGVGVMGLVGVLFLIIPRTLAGIFSADANVLALSVILLRLMALYQIFDGLNIVFRGALNGAGDTRFTGLVTVIGAWGLFVPSTYIWAFTFDFGLLGAWAGAIGYLIVLGIVFTARFRSGKWKQIEV